RSWRYSVEGGRVTVSSLDEAAHQTTLYLDMFNRTRRVREYAGQESWDTSYEYDVLGHPIRITDAAGNVTSLRWDSLGQKVSSDDPDMGEWTYAYDSVGNLVSQTDARGVVTAFTYDAARRVLTKQWNPP